MTYQQAIKEAYATADIEEVALDTLELRHPNFVDGEGNHIAVRIVIADDSYTLRLENDAPENAGQYVEFLPCPFQFQLPEFEEGSKPELQIRIDNVSRDITKYLEMAAEQLIPIGVTYRPYLISDPTGPQMNPPMHMTLTKVTVDAFQATGTATMNDVYNFAFPNAKYTPQRFPALVR